MSSFPPDRPAPALDAGLRPTATSLADGLPVGVAAIDRNGRQVYVNAALERMLGWSASELLGATAPFVYWPEEERDRILESFEATLRGEAPPEGWRLRFQHRDGTRVDVLVHIGPIGPMPHESEGWVAAVVDISARVAIERALRANEAMLLASESRYRALVEATTEMVWRTGPDGVLTDVPFWQELTGQAPQEMSEDWMSVIHPQDRERTVHAWRGALAAVAPYENEFRVRLQDGVYRWYRARGVPVHDADGSLREWVGVLLDIDREHRLTDGRMLIDRAALALSESLDVATTLDAIAQCAVPSFADWSVVLLQQPDGLLHRVATAAATEQTAAVLAELMRLPPLDPNDQSPVAVVFRECRSRLLEPGGEIARHIARMEGRPRELVEQLDPRNALLAPMRARGQVLGVLALGRGPSDQRYTEDDLRTAEELAARAAIAIDNARLYEAERSARQAAEHSARQLAALQRATAELTASLTPQQVADVVMRASLPTVGAVRGSVALLTDDGAAVEVIGAMGYPPEVLARYRRVPLETPFPLADVVRTGQPVMLPSAEARDRQYPHLAALRRANGAGAMAALPLVVDGRAVGALGINWGEDHAFDAEESAFLLALAQQCAQALDRSRLYLEEHKARMDAEQANRAKSDFLAAMSHELRTPLNGISGYVDLLEMELRGPITPEQRQDLQRIRHNQQHLLSLIEDVLSFARIEAGRLDVERVPVPLDETMRALEAMILPQMTTKSLRYRCEPGAPGLTVLGDRARILQILVNLVTNAIKATPEGGAITLSCRHEADQVLVDVRDTGVGIAVEQLETIFSPFTQLGRSLRNPRAGAGLGLSISRGLARSMHGSLTVQSEIGVGSTFTLTLAAYTADALADALADAARAQAQSVDTPL